MLEPIACNLCGADDAAVMYEARGLTQAAQAFRATVTEFSGFYRMVRCRRCGLVYASPRDSDEALRAEYEMIRDPGYHEEMDARRRNAARVLGVLERDYLLSWILAGISRVDALRETLVFKGGTALKKCYFGDYRFSEDLDFTGVGSVPTGAAMETAIRDACAMAAQRLDPYAPVEIVCARHVERDPHPADQEAFDIRARFPWHRRPQTRVMVEVTVDEKLLTPHPPRPVLHEYGEPFDIQVQVYSLEEIVAEKLRAILQHARALESLGWVRSRARDYYDLWRILGASRDRLDVPDFPAFLREKCAPKGVAFSGAKSFFPEAMLPIVEKTWEQWLGPLVPNLPPYKTVIADLRSQVAALLGVSL